MDPSVPNIMNLDYLVKQYVIVFYRTATDIPRKADLV